MTQRITDKQAREVVRSKLRHVSMIAQCDLAADLLDARAEIATLREQLAKVCAAGKHLLDANRTVNIYANDEWRTRRGGLEAAIAAARAEEEDRTPAVPLRR